MKYEFTEEEKKAFADAEKQVEMVKVLMQQRNELLLPAFQRLRLEIEALPVEGDEKTWYMYAMACEAFPDDRYKGKLRSILQSKIIPY